MRRVGALDQFLTWVHWLWFFEPYVALVFILLRHPAALPARRAPARRRLRHRLRRLLRGADRAALVGLRAGADRRGGAADHGRGRRGLLGSRLAADVRRARRQPLGGDALAPLRHLGGRRRSRWPKRARAAGAVGWAYALTLGFALVYLGEHYVTDLAAGAALVGRRAARASRSPSRSSAASTAACSAWSASRTGSVLWVSEESSVKVEDVAVPIEETPPNRAAPNFRCSRRGG